MKLKLELTTDQIQKIRFIMGYYDYDIESMKKHDDILEGDWDFSTRREIEEWFNTLPEADNFIGDNIIEYILFRNIRNPEDLFTAILHKAKPRSHEYKVTDARRERLKYQLDIIRSKKVREEQG